MTKRNRVLYAILGLISGGLALASRRFAANLPAFIAEYAGDTLWAAGVYLIAAAVFPRAETTHLAGKIYLLSVAIELSQLYSAPWIDAIRANPLGGVILGYTFLWSDLVCYFAGVVIAAMLDIAIIRSAAREAKE
jgi:hypothetical protein